MYELKCKIGGWGPRFIKVVAFKVTNMGRKNGFSHELNFECINFGIATLRDSLDATIAAPSYATSR